MNKLQKRVQQRGQGGFTLIELLVVIAILAILAGVVVFAVGNSTKNADVSACKTEKASIITAISAADTSNKVNPSGSYEGPGAYLKGTQKFFTVTWSGNTTTLGAVTVTNGTMPGTGCTAMVATDASWNGGNITVA